MLHRFRRISGRAQWFDIESALPLLDPDLRPAAAVVSCVVGDCGQFGAVGEGAFDHHDALEEVGTPLGFQWGGRWEDAVDVLVVD